MKISTKIQMALLAIVAVLFSGGCWGGRYQWALTGLIDHGLNSVDEFNFENGNGMLMVKTSEGYWVGQTEVTQSQFEKIMGYNPIDKPISQFRSKRIATYRQPDIPVIYVSAKEAMSFCQKLTEIERSKDALLHGYIYSLPIEKQWRAFVADAKLDDSVIPKGRYILPGPESVASLPANRLGLFDVRGNVYEYCIISPLGAKDQKSAVKGGAFDSIDWETRQIDCRSSWIPIGKEGRGRDVGFRVVLVKESGSE
jgi:formylglycine-generating enzyme required for sulfatase activity